MLITPPGLDDLMSAIPRGVVLPTAAAAPILTPSSNLAAAPEPNPLTAWVTDQLRAQTERALDLASTNKRFLAVTAGATASRNIGLLRS